MCEAIAKDYPISLFNQYQKRLQTNGEKPLFCTCKINPCTYRVEEDADKAELDECEECKRLVPFCYMGYGDGLCNFCWGAKNWQNCSVVEVVLKGEV